ncbi:MAG TPA: DUF4336 domain-containing protein [Bradyrhizobium sp.]|uniref:DUF4336 domain-containing protein n=1 Tax=Bradyrhizobium sp. TaxID=376 RepID=UPI002D7FB409|nr:DUF4336 domain-containing protein [Bradyrhizobium sp.]HET7887122.1 DUF4336 domain-containing protein [Bradyrhizobium sp.]
MLKPFTSDIWIADGPHVSTAGFHYGTRMAVIRLADGGLFVWSPVKLTESLRREVDALGEVRHLVPPNSLHHLFVDDWRRTYPKAILYAPPGLRTKRKDLEFDADLTEEPAAAWAGDLDQVVVPGCLITTEVVFFHRKSATALFTDLIQQFPSTWFSGWRATVARLDLMTKSEPAVPRKFRLMFAGRRIARAALARIEAWPTEKVLMAHGTPVERDGQAFIARAFAWLTG